MITLGLANSGPAYLASWSGDTKTAIVGDNKVLIYDSEAKDFKQTTISSLLGGINVILYKGVIDCSASPNYPAADAGHEYRVSVAGKIGGASGKIVEAGDVLICNTDSTVAGTDATVGSYWNILQLNIQRPVEAPSSSTDNAIVRFDGTTGGIIQNSGITIDDSNNINTTAQITAEQINTEKIKGLSTTGGTGIEIQNASGQGIIIDSSGNTSVDTGNFTVANGTATISGQITQNSSKRVIDEDMFDNISLQIDATTGGLEARIKNLVPICQTLTDAANIAWNLSSGGHAQVTLGDNRNLSAPTNLEPGMRIILEVIQDGTGGRTLSFDTIYKFPGGTDPVMSTAISARDVLEFVISRDGTMIYGVANYSFS